MAAERRVTLAASFQEAVLADPGTALRLATVLHDLADRGPAAAAVRVTQHATAGDSAVVNQAGRDLLPYPRSPA